MGEQLRNTNAEVRILIIMINNILFEQIVYLDFSRASMYIAQQRVDIRHLVNVRFVHEKIENLPGLGLGENFPTYRSPIIFYPSLSIMLRINCRKI